MATEPEAQRLIRVYGSYRTSKAIRARWDDRNPGNRAILRERSRAITALLRAHGLLPLGDRRVLDVGCGSGKVLASMVQLGARPENLHGVDLIPDRIEEAKAAYPGLRFLCANAERLDFPEAYFDLVVLFTVFSSILDGRMAQSVAREVSRVLRPGGAGLWYDTRYDNPGNPHVRGMTLGRIRRIFPDLEVHVRSISLLPPLARRLGPVTPVVYPLLTLLPPLRTHYLGLLVKSAVARPGGAR